MRVDIIVDNHAILVLNLKGINLVLIQASKQAIKDINSIKQSE